MPLIVEVLLKDRGNVISRIFVWVLDSMDSGQGPIPHKKCQMKVCKRDMLLTWKLIIDVACTSFTMLQVITVCL